MDQLEFFLREFIGSLKDGSFIKLTLSKPTNKQSALKNVYLRLIEIKEQPHISFNYRYETNDQTKNLGFNDSEGELRKLLEEQFRTGTLFTSTMDLTVQQSKKGQWSSFKKKPSQTQPEEATHDRQKHKHIPSETPFLKSLGVVDSTGQVIPKMADKYRQINKYIEIIDGLVKQYEWQQPIKIVDMGSGKGYLTFALYHYLTTNDFSCELTGVEMRTDLVEKCNQAAKECEYDNLKFVESKIEDYQAKEIDILIALHACDTATDDSIANGIMSNANLIITAPCCHKQIRQQVKGKKQEDPLLKYGIFQERQFEMVTDAMRALILESKGYKSRIFEFVSNEHTRKNVMLIGEKRPESSNAPDSIRDKIDDLKQKYHIDYHYLEKALS